MQLRGSKSAGLGTGIFITLLLVEGLSFVAAKLATGVPPEAWIAVRVGAAFLLSATVDRWAARAGARRARPMAIVERLALRAGRPREIQATLDSGVLEVCRLLSAPTACLRLLDRRGDLVAAASLNVTRGHLEVMAEVTPRKPDLLAAIQVGRSTVLPGTALDDDLCKALSTVRGRSTIGIVLAADGKTQGLIVVELNRRIRLDPETLRTLRTIAAILAGAIAGARTYEALLRESQTDPLTGVGSRRHFDELYKREVARAGRSGQPLCLAMIDVDNMKSINDNWGHISGDRVLEAMGQMLKGVRAGDVAARYGGDEFVLLMPETEEEEARYLVRRIRARLQRLNDAQIFPFPVTLSIGLSELKEGDDLIARADADMYDDKKREPRDASRTLEATGKPAVRLFRSKHRPEQLN